MVANFRWLCGVIMGPDQLDPSRQTFLYQTTPLGWVAVLRVDNGFMLCENLNGLINIYIIYIYLLP